MKYHKQLFNHDPENGEFGDCDRTCMACLLDLDPADIPNWGVHYDDAGKFNLTKEDWLASKGLWEVQSAFDCSLDDMEHNLRLIWPDVYVLLTGKSNTNCDHVVVTLNGKIIHDPSKEDAGIVGPCLDGYWRASVLVPLSLRAPREVRHEQAENKP